MGVLANVFGGSGQFGGGPTAVTAQNLTSEGFDLTKPFIQDVLEASRAQFFEDVEDPDTGDTVQQLRAFDQFTGPRIADFAPEQQEAFTGLAALGREGLASTDLGRSPQFFQQAKEKAGLGSLGFTGEDFERFTQDVYRPVIDEAKREAVRQFESVIQPKLRAEAVGAGSFGGSRAAILEAEAQRNLQRQLDDIESKGLATSFEQAQRSFEAEKARELQSAGLFSQLGEAVPAQAARELALLSSVGEAQQAQEQAALNLAERDFIEQREFPLRQLQEFQSLVRGFPFTPSTYQVTTQQTPQPSFGQQLLGTLGTGVGIFGALGGFKNKAGGQVVPRQSGGQVRGGLAGLERHYNNLRYPDNIYGPPSRDQVLRQRPLTPSGEYIPGYGPRPPALDPMAGRDRTSFFDVVASIFNRPNQTPTTATERRFDNERPLPPVVRVGEAVPGNLSQTSALIEAIQPKEKSISDYLNMVNSKPTGEYTSPVAVSLDENYNVVKPRDISASEAYNPGRMDPTGMLGESRLPQSYVDDYMSSMEADKLLRRATRMGSGPSRTNILEPMQDIEGGLAEEVEIKEKKIQSDDPSRRPKATVKLDMKKMETEALARKAAEDKAAKAAAKEGGGDGGILDANENKNLQDGKREFSSAYDTLDKAFDDYLSFLEKKKEETDVEMAEAQEAREMRLFAELAATSARFAGQAGPGGFLAKLNQAALPSIAELKDIQSDFRKEMKAAKDIEGDILKDKLNINLARAKLDMERSKLESENNLRAAKAQAELTADAYGQDAKETVDSLDKAMTGLTVSNQVRAAAFNLQAQLLYKGEDPDKAYATTMRFVRSQTGVRPSGASETRTTQAALNDAQQAAKKKLDAASKLPK